MQREEKQLDSSLDALIQRVAEVKSNIAAFLMKLEHEYEILNWPTMLDNFALLSGQINSLHRLIKNEKMPTLRNYVMLPLALSPERDPDLEKLTEGRVLAFNHEVVPDYLRTKPDPELEEKITQLTMRSNTIPQDTFQKQMNNLNKIIYNTSEMIQSQREETENDINQKTAPAQTSLQAETNSLIAAISFGKNLKPLRGRIDTSSPIMHSSGNAPGTSSQSMSGGSGMSHSSTAGGNVHVNKAQSGLKSNIRQGVSHPYSRP